MQRIAAVCQFAFALFFAGKFLWEGQGTFYGVMALLLLVAGLGSVWRGRRFGKAITQLHAAADAPRENASML
jgi:hypothetical protein